MKLSLCNACSLDCSSSSSTLGLGVPCGMYVRGRHLNISLREGRAVAADVSLLLITFLFSVALVSPLSIPKSFCSPLFTEL